MNLAAIAMFVLYGLLALVTHLSAPIGAVWKVQPGIDGSNLLGMAGKMSFIWLKSLIWCSVGELKIFDLV